VNPSPEAAAHLAEIDQRFEDHLAALRRRADEAKGQIETDAARLHEQASPQRDLHEVAAWGVEAPPPYTPPPPNPFAENALIPDTPLLAVDEAPALDNDLGALTDEDGIPLWQD
jgi:hypothetical protein